MPVGQLDSHSIALYEDGDENQSQRGTTAVMLSEQMLTSKKMTTIVRWNSQKSDRCEVYIIFATGRIVCLYSAAR